MGEHGVRRVRGEGDERAFTRALLHDLSAFERILSSPLVERGRRRVGVEQELFLVDAAGRPAPCSSDVLERLGDPRFTTELALFNLEANLPPVPLDGTFLRTVERMLGEILVRVRDAAAALGAEPLLVGILPTLRRSDLGPRNMSPEPRYRMLEEGVQRLRGGPVAILIRGTDELYTDTDSVMPESANTSIQLHLQVDPEDFAAHYNAAQALSAPLLAAATGSPLLLGRRLWKETRVALFERSVDARSGAQRARGQRPRVTFGESWVRESPVELFREDAARCRVLLVRDVDEDPLEMLDRGELPPLSALTLHNGTVWRWNRACLSFGQGVAQLRIENRVLPAGPTVLDETANAALFYGLLLGLPRQLGDVSRRMRFDDAKEGFLHAARHGLDARLPWMDGRRVGVRELLLDELLPLARVTLAELGVPVDDLDRYLGVIEERVRTERTLSRWLLDAVEDGPGSRDVRVHAATRELMERERTGAPVHTWPPARGAVAVGEVTVGELMTTDLFTVRPEDVIDLAAEVMQWKDVHHVPVEGGDGVVVGLVSRDAVERLRAEQRRGLRSADVAVRELMDPDPPLADASTPLADCLELLVSSGAGCLLVLEEGRLAGIVTERDVARALDGGRQP